MNALVEEREKPKCGLRVLAFPCNQFGKQEPGKNADEILNGLKYVRPGKNFIPNFPMFKKRNVNGKGEDEIFTFLKSRCPSPGGIINDLKNIDWSPVKNNDISWNFEKILVDHMGQPYRRYHPHVTPREIDKDIQHLMEKCEKNEETKRVLEHIRQGQGD